MELELFGKCLLIFGGLGFWVIRILFGSWCRVFLGRKRDWEGRLVICLMKRDWRSEYVKNFLMLLKCKWLSGKLEIDTGRYLEENMNG